MRIHEAYDGNPVGINLMSIGNCMEKRHVFSRFLLLFKSPESMIKVSKYVQTIGYPMSAARYDTV